MDLTTDYITNDLSLLSRCKKGENAAYKELYGRYAKAMLNISLRIVNNKDEAEDVLQESFLKAFQNIANFDAEAAFGSWLKRVVINRSIDLVRKQNRNFISLDHEDYAEEQEEEEAVDSDMAYDIESLKTCIAELPDGYRLVLTLFLFEKCSHKEIAAMLSISEGTSKSQYNRAKKKLIQRIRQKKES
jgi:RNA polymerase sigma-70 factor, ECF subfamily